MPRRYLRCAVRLNSGAHADTASWRRTRAYATLARVRRHFAVRHSSGVRPGQRTFCITRRFRAISRLAFLASDRVATGWRARPFFRKHIATTPATRALTTGDLNLARIAFVDQLHPFCQRRVIASATSSTPTHVQGLRTLSTAARAGKASGLTVACGVSPAVSNNSFKPTPLRVVVIPSCVRLLPLRLLACGAA